MILSMCAVYDKKVGAYVAPQFFRSNGEAIRAFMDAVASSDTPFAKHPEDYHFSLLGTYDDGLGIVTHDGNGPSVLITALECVSKQ